MRTREAATVAAALVPPSFFLLTVVTRDAHPPFPLFLLSPSLYTAPPRTCEDSIFFFPPLLPTRFPVEGTHPLSSSFFFPFYEQSRITRFRFSPPVRSVSATVALLFLFPEREALVVAGMSLFSPLSFPFLDDRRPHQRALPFLSPLPFTVRGETVCPIFSLPCVT